MITHNFYCAKKFEKCELKKVIIMSKNRNKDNSSSNKELKIRCIETFHTQKNLI